MSTRCPYINGESVSGTTGDQTVAYPSGIMSGHLLLGVLFRWAGISLSDPPTPDGWTQISNINWDYLLYLTSYYRIADGTEAGSVSFTSDYGYGAYIAHHGQVAGTPGTANWGNWGGFNQVTVNAAPNPQTVTVPTWVDAAHAQFVFHTWVCQGTKIGLASPPAPSPGPTSDMTITDTEVTPLFPITWAPSNAQYWLAHSGGIFYGIGETVPTSSRQYDQTSSYLGVAVAMGSYIEDLTGPDDNWAWIS